MVQTLTPQDVRAVSPQANRIIRFAHQLGWSMRWASAQHKAVAVHSPLDNKFVIIPVATSVNHNRHRSMINQIIAHSPDDAMKIVYEGVKGDLTKDPELAELALMLGITKYSVDQKIEEEARHLQHQLVDEMVEETAARLREIRTETKVESDIKGDWYAVSTVEGSWFECKAHEAPMRVATTAGIGGHNRVHHPSEDAMPMAEASAKAHAVQSTKALERKAAKAEVSRVPWLAKKGSSGSGEKGRVVEHSYVQEVTYEDGHVEFECVICHQTYERGRQCSSHVGQAHKDRDRDHVAPVITISGYQPDPDLHPQRQNHRLRNDILAALDTIENWSSLSRDELATRMEAVITENRPDRAPVEPLTDAEVLARITALVERGQYDSMRTQLHSLNEQIVGLVAERDADRIARSVAEGQAERAKSNLTTLTELLADLQKDTE